MDTQSGRSRTVGSGALLGALAGLLLAQLGAADITGAIQRQTIVIACLGVGAVIGFSGWGRLLAIADGLLVAVYLTVSYAPLMARVGPPWVRVDSLPPAADAVVVLSSGILSDSALDVDGLDRILTAAELLDRGSAPRIVTTRVEKDYPLGLISSDADQRRILTMGHATRQWNVVDSVHSTHDEALHVARLLLPAGARSIVLVTSPMHTRRACATFEAAGFEVACRAAREHDRVTWHPQSPSDRLAAFRAYLYERLGMVKYRYEGWLPKGD